MPTRDPASQGRGRRCHVSDSRSVGRNTQCLGENQSTSVWIRIVPVPIGPSMLRLYLQPRETSLPLVTQGSRAVSEGILSPWLHEPRRVLYLQHISTLLVMNWTEGNLYRHNRGRLRKANPARQRQKEYFARARARAAELKAATENGPPPISFLQSSPASSRRSRASNRSGSSAGRRLSQTPSRQRTEPDRKRTKTTTVPDDSPLPTISRFFQEHAARGDAASPAVEYDEEALERMKQKLLAKKD